MEPIWAVGLMTGTVLDGNIDVALLRTDGETVAEFGPYTLAPYDAATRDLLQRTLEAALAWGFDGPEPAIFAEAEAALTRAQAEAVRAHVEASGLTLADIGIVGFHGQSRAAPRPRAGPAGAHAPARRRRADGADAGPARRLRLPQRRRGGGRAGGAAVGGLPRRAPARPRRRTPTPRC